MKILLILSIFFTYTIFSGDQQLAPANKPHVIFAGERIFYPDLKIFTSPEITLNKEQSTAFHLEILSKALPTLLLERYEANKNNYQKHKKHLFYSKKITK